MRCAVTNCGNNNRNNNRKKWRYFHFPKDETQLKWIDFCKRETPINIATACICNEHFAPDDFERNMLYDFGFTSKNPTKLKAGSCPTLNSPSILALQKTKKKSGRSKNNKISKLKVEALHTEEVQPSSVLLADNVIEIELFDCTSNMEDIYSSYQNNDHHAIESPEKTQSNDQIITHMEMEMLDSVALQTNNEEHVEIVESIDGTYVKHLEMELKNLKCQVFHLKDEREKFLDEIENLRASLRQTEFQRDDAINKLHEMAKKLEPSISPFIKKKSVMRSQGSTLN